MRVRWWKWVAAIILFYTIIAGFLLPVPVLPILNETARNIYFHVPMWFSMVVLYLISVVYSVRYLSSSSTTDDLIAVESVNVGIVFCFFGLITGMLWANVTWGEPWPSDPKLNSSAIATLMYLAYILLRNSIEEEQKRAKISAIYNVFAFPIMVVLIFILPRLTDSLHPGNGGNPAFSNLDMDGTMRLVFYPAVIGWILIGVWMMTLRYRYRVLRQLTEQAD